MKVTIFGPLNFLDNFQILLKTRTVSIYKNSLNEAVSTRTQSLSLREQMKKVYPCNLLFNFIIMGWVFNNIGTLACR